MTGSLSDVASEVAQNIESATDMSVSQDDVEDRIAQTQEEFNLPVDEAARVVQNQATPGNSSAPNPDDVLSLDSLEEEGDGAWGTVPAAEVVQVLEDLPDAIDQKVIIADETAQAFITVFNEDAPELEEGGTYEFDNVVTDEFNGNYSLKVVSNSEVSETDSDIEAHDGSESLRGQISRLYDGEGLIKRCSEEGCNRKLNDGECAEHGDVEGEWDLRLKAVVEDGNSSETVIFNTESVEEILGLSVEEAVDKAMDALDTGIINRDAGDELVNRYIDVTGQRYGDFLVATEWEFVEGADEDALVAAGERAEALAD